MFILLPENYVEVPTYRTDFKGNEMAKLALDPAVVAKVTYSNSSFTYYGLIGSR